MWNKLSGKKEEARKTRKGRRERKRQRERGVKRERKREMGVPFLSSLCEYAEIFRLKY